MYMISSDENAGECVSFSLAAYEIKSQRRAHRSDDDVAMRRQRRSALTPRQVRDMSLDLSTLVYDSYGTRRHDNALSARRTCRI